MAEKDAVTKAYMSDPEVFADLCNYYLYGGREVILPENLTPLDTAEIAIPYGKSRKKKSKRAIQRYRDVFKRAVIMQDSKAMYCLIGAENQSEMHNAMVPKDMLYDAVSYVDQVEAIARKHAKNKDKPENSADFLSGFHREDRLIPVITLTVYWGADEWTAPTDLHEMMDMSPELARFVPNYWLNLISPATIKDEDFSKFRTELAAALKYVKYSKDKQKLDEVLHGDVAYHDLSRQTANLVNVVTGSNLKFPEGEERVDMCEAITQMVNEAVSEARNEAWDEATHANAVAIAKNLLALGKLTYEEIVAVSGLTLAEVQALAGEKTA